MLQPSCSRTLRAATEVQSLQLFTVMPSDGDNIGARHTPPKQKNEAVPWLCGRQGMHAGSVTTADMIRYCICDICLVLSISVLPGLWDLCNAMQRQPKGC